MPRLAGRFPVATALKAILSVAVAALVAASAAALLARLGWPFELFAHFRPQYAASAAVAAVACLLLQRPFLAAVAAIVATLNAALVIAAVPASAANETCGEGPVVTVATVNAWFHNDDAQPLLRWLAATEADVVVVQEVTPHWATALATLDEFPYRELHARADPYGIAILRRLPLRSISLHDLAGDARPSLDVLLDAGGQQVRLLGLHTRWPVLPGLQRRRDRGLTAAAELVRASQSPVIVAGDLNLTPWAPAFGKFLERSGLRDPFGRSLQPTWFAGFWPLALRIDHVLVPGGFCAVHTEVGPDIGSDHRPVLVSLRWRAPVSPPEASRP